VVGEYWATPTMTADEFVGKWNDTVAQAK